MTISKEVIRRLNEMDIEETLKERAENYGEFKEQADMSQRLKLIMAETDNWNRLSYDQKEALEMIAMKISRILTGNFNHLNSWHDIEGYARLIANTFYKESEA